MTDRKPMTFRDLAAYWRMTVEELADAEIGVGVKDGHLNFDSSSLNMHFPAAALHHGGPDGKKLYLRFDCHLSRHRLVKERSR